MADALLRVADQQRGRVPLVCVKSGEPTRDVVTVTAVARASAERWELWLGPLAVVLARLQGKPLFRATIPVDTRERRRVTRGRGWATLLCLVALVAMIAAVPNGGFASLATTWLLLVPGWLLRARCQWSRWIGVEFRPSHQDVRITRVHPRFAEAARTLWLKFMPRAAPPPRQG